MWMLAGGTLCVAVSMSSALLFDKKLMELLMIEGCDVGTPKMWPIGHR